MSNLELIVSRLLRHCTWSNEFLDIPQLLLPSELTPASISAWQSLLCAELTRVDAVALRLEADLLRDYDSLRTQMLACDFILSDDLGRNVLRFMANFHAAREFVPLCRFVIRQFTSILQLRLSEDSRDVVNVIQSDIFAHFDALPAAKSQFMKNFEPHIAQLMVPPSAAEDMSFVTLAKEITEYTSTLFRAKSPAEQAHAAPVRSADGITRVTKLDRFDCEVGTTGFFSLTLFNAGDANPMPPLSALVARGEEHGPVLCVYTLIDENCSAPALATALHNITGRLQLDRLRGTVIAIVATMPTRLSPATSSVMRQRLRERLVPACDVVLELVGPQVDFRCGTTAVCDLSDVIGTRIAQLCEPRVIVDQSSADALLPNLSSLALATFEYNKVAPPAVAADARITLTRPAAVACMFATTTSPQPAAVNALANTIGFLQMARAHIRRDLDTFPYILPFAHVIVVADGGTFVAAIGLGSFVKANVTVLGRMIDGFGREISELYSPVDGILTGVTFRALVMSGTLVAVVCRWS